MLVHTPIYYHHSCSLMMFMCGFCRRVMVVAISSYCWSVAGNLVSPITTALYNWTFRIKKMHNSNRQIEIFKKSLWLSATSPLRPSFQRILYYCFHSLRVIPTHTFCPPSLVITTSPFFYTLLFHSISPVVHHSRFEMKVYRGVARGCFLWCCPPLTVSYIYPR